MNLSDCSQLIPLTVSKVLTDNLIKETLHSLFGLLAQLKHGRRARIVSSCKTQKNYLYIFAVISRVLCPFQIAAELGFYNIFAADQNS